MANLWDTRMRTKIILTGTPTNMVESDQSSLVLASSSPRRSQLMRSAGLDFLTLAPNVDERDLPGEHIEKYVSRIAFKKWRRVAREMVGYVVISADTAVEGASHKPLPKPEDVQEAASLLWWLRGRSVRIVTGLTVGSWGSGHLVAITRVSTVVFRNFLHRDFEAYIGTGESVGKAGAFGIQDAQAWPLLKEYVGCYTNIVGLPVCDLLATLQGRATIPEYVCRCGAEVPIRKVTLGIPASSE